MEMEAVQSLIRIIVGSVLVILLLPKDVQTRPRPQVILLIYPENRMIKPPTFPYEPPYGYHTSGLLCYFNEVPYVGGWLGRSCAGPVRPFQISPPSTTTTPRPAVGDENAALQQMMLMGHGPSLYNYFYNNFNNNNNNANYNPDYDGEPIEGSPWDEDDDDLFIESYGVSASKPGFRLGDPSRHS